MAGPPQTNGPDQLRQAPTPTQPMQKFPQPSAQQPPMPHAPMQQAHLPHAPLPQAPMQQAPMQQPSMQQPPLQSAQQPLMHQQQLPPVAQLPMNKVPTINASPMGMPPMPNANQMGMPPMPNPSPMGMPPMPNQQFPSGAPGIGQQQPPFGAPNQQFAGQPMGAPPMPQMQQFPQQQGMPPQPAANYQQNYGPQGNMPPMNRQFMQPGQAPYNQPNQYPPGMAAPPPQRRLDPDQMPNPIQVMTENQRSITGPFLTAEAGAVPPLVTTKFITHDQGNSGPRYIRSTMYNVPATPDMIKQTSVPFSLIISPMADTAEGEIIPPIVDFGELGPIRCVRCKAYMSPNMQFVDAGRRFRCAMCKATSDGKYHFHR